MRASSEAVGTHQRHDKIAKKPRRDGEAEDQIEHPPLPQRRISARVAAMKARNPPAPSAR
jgi:hypothetical protein